MGRQPDRSGRDYEEASGTPDAAPQDPHRLVYSLTAPRMWLNDLNGLIRWGDEYHLFDQCNPHSMGFESMSWTHAKSRDLAHWQRLPVALEPDAP